MSLSHLLRAVLMTVWDVNINSVLLGCVVMFELSQLAFQ